MKRKQLLLVAAVVPGLMALAQDSKHTGGPASLQDLSRQQKATRHRNPLTHLAQTVQDTTE